jgi:hypothetical protein
MSTKKMIMIGSVALVALIAILASWLPANAAQSNIYPAKVGTIESGKQGLVLSNVPERVKYVAFDLVKPPLPPRYLQGVDIAYRGPTVEISFLNNKKEIINYSGATAQVFFNISVPEKNMWDQGGSDALAIWHYNEDARQWEMCPTVLVEEKANNGKYDRLACFVFQNGIYLLGKLSFDPVFPLWFKPYDVGDPNSTGPTLLQSEVFSAKTGTFEFGKQGVVLNTIPAGFHYVSFLRIQPPLPPRLHQGIDIAYRGPAIDITFLNSKKAPVESGGLNAQVFFNISSPEKKIWDVGGPDAIAIWHYNAEEQNWEMCPTFYVPEKQNNANYDRLTCYIKQNGIYILGKMEFDPFFPLWFKPYTKDVPSTIY